MCNLLGCYAYRQCQEPSQVLPVRPAAQVIITGQGFDRSFKKKRTFPRERNGGKSQQITLSTHKHIHKPPVYLNYEKHYYYENPRLNDIQKCLWFAEALLSDLGTKK